MTVYNNKSIKSIYDSFCAKLKQEKKKGNVLILNRGEDKEFAFKYFNLDINYNTIEQFAERLFFFGNKARYFWNEKLKSGGNDFEINDISNVFFKFIFNEFNKLTTNPEKCRTIKYFGNEPNKLAVEFFRNSKNVRKFIKAVNTLDEKDKTTIRNHYLTLLHQLNETEYKENSHFVSSSKREATAKGFGKKDNIVIKFWMLNPKKTCNHFPKLNRIPSFYGKPYKSQKEISVFTAIFPHFIHSFTYNGESYINPAMSKVKNNEYAIEYTIISGLNINQNDFIERRKKETNFSKSVESKNGEIKEV